MEYLPRQLEGTIRRISARYPVVLVTGARQTGKTTLLRRLAATGRTYVNLDDPGARALARSDPELFLQDHPPPLLIDEIQYALDLLPSIKLRVDENRKPGQYWLTGSQRFEAMRGVAETLAGRIAILELLGMSWREAWNMELDLPPFLPTTDNVDERGYGEPAFDRQSLGEAVWLGGYPFLCADEEEDRDVFYSSYLQTYIQRDVRDLRNIGDLESFMRFVRACAVRTASLLNLSNLARDVDVSVPTARSWLSVLVASGLVYLLPPYFTNRTKRIVKTPKLHFLDTGLACYLAGWSSPAAMIRGAAAGALVESWVVAEVIKSYANVGRTPPIHFFRTHDGTEVDLLFEVDRVVHPVEIKLGATPRPAWSAAFDALERAGLDVGEGGVLSLVPRPISIDRRTRALPFGAV